MNRVLRELRTAGIGNRRNCCRLIKRAGPRKPSISEVISSLTHAQGRPPGRSTETFREQLSYPTLTMGLPLMPVGEPMQIDASPPS